MATKYHNSAPTRKRELSWDPGIKLGGDSGETVTLEASKSLWEALGATSTSPYIFCDTKQLCVNSHMQLNVEMCIVILASPLR